MSGDQVFVDGPAIAHYLGLSLGTIRNWATEGRITRRGTDARGRALYDLDEVENVAGRTSSAPPLLGSTFRDEFDYLHSTDFGPFEPSDYGDRQ